MGRRPRALRRRAAHHRQAQVLLPGDAALSQRPAAHGPRAQLLHRRRARALHVDARLQRPAPHGLGRLRSARRKRRPQEQHAAARVDARQHRADEACRCAASASATTGRTEVTTCLPDYYRWNQWFFLKMFERGPRLPQTEQGQLVPRVRHRPRQRAGRRRLLLASRRHPRRAARPRTVVPPHHQVRRRTARRPRHDARLAGKSPHHAAQLDRPQRRRGGRLRRRWRVGPERSRVFTTRIDTIFGATCDPVAPEHPLVRQIALREPEAQGRRSTR